MIFVTVGTHEQPFNRLVKSLDTLKGNGIIQEEVIIQTGYSTYQPQYCNWFKLLPYSQIIEFMDRAHIIITHGGPSSFIMALQRSKIPIVVPRQKKYGEHVNDHQLNFVKSINEKMKNIIVIEDINEIKDIIQNYDSYVDQINSSSFSNNQLFLKNFELLVHKLLSQK